MIYQYTIFPLEKFLSITLSLLHGVTGSYLFSLILLSVVVRLITTPLEKLANKSAIKEHEINSVLAPQIAQIKAKFKGVERHEAIKRLYARYSYHPIYALRSMFSLLVQLPFFIAAFYMISEATVLRGVIVPLVGDLGQQDKILWGTVNLLPFIMTGINLFALFTTPDFNKKESIQGVCIALLFLVLLYNSPAALLIYWTFNNFISLCKNLLSLSFDSKKEKTKVTKKKKTVAEQFQEVTSLAQKEFQYGKFISLGAYICFFFAFQEILYLLAMESWETMASKRLFVFSGMYLGMTITSLVAKKLKLKSLILLFLCVFFVIFWAFYLPTKPYQILNPNSLAAFFLLLSSVIALKLCEKQNTFNTKEYFLFTLLASFAGFVFHWANNTDYLFLETTSFYFLIAISLPLIFCTLSFSFLRNTHKYIPLEGIGACCFLSFLFLPTIHGVLVWKSYLAEYFILLSISFSIITFLLYKKKETIYVFLGIAILANSISGISQVYSSQKTKYQTSNTLEKRLEFTKQLTTDKLEMPNIYILTSESTTDLTTAEQLGIPTERIKKLLTRYDFKIYNSTYSLGRESLPSVSTTLNILKEVKGGNDGARQVNGGDSFVNRWLQTIGYHTVSTMENYMTGGYNYYNESSTSPSIQKQIKWDFLKTILQGIGQREFKFDIGLHDNLDRNKITDGSQKNNYEQYIDEVIKRDKLNPTFAIYHGKYPLHSQNSGICREDETDIYNKSFEKAVTLLERKLALIKKYDPDSIVVIMGDHGPYLRGDCAYLKNYQPSEVTELFMRDRIGTLVAIHWPDKYKAEKYDKNLLMNQDIFPIIFSYLYDSPEPLSLKLEPVASHFGRTIKNGKFL
jgi:membrane protein insertase Oxa1/YidC/SpoIIIJ